MQIVYNGPHPEVVVDEFDQETVIVAGQPVDIPDDLAARLLEQDTWHPADNAAQNIQAKIDADKAALAADLATAAAQTTPSPDSGADAATAPQDAPQGTSGDDSTKGNS